MGRAIFGAVSSGVCRRIATFTTGRNRRSSSKERRPARLRGAERQNSDFSLVVAASLGSRIVARSARCSARVQDATRRTSSYLLVVFRRLAHAVLAAVNVEVRHSAL